jgi:hypothetical protein
MGSEEQLQNEANTCTATVAPSPPVGAVPLSSGLIALKWEGEMLFSRFHVTHLIFPKLLY